MKKLLAVAVATTILSGCSSISNPFADNKVGTVVQPTTNETAVKERTISTEFIGNSIKLEYTLLGDLKAIEVVGVAEVWRGQPEIVAEADAKEKLVKFIYGEDVDSNRTTRIIAKSIDKARDNAVNQLQSDLGTEISMTDKQLEDNAEPSPQDQNTSRRIATTVNQVIANSVTNVSSTGRLTGLRKVHDELRESGKIYAATYRWTEKDLKTATQIRNLMSAN
jgi:hypothetical protein